MTTLTSSTSTRLSLAAIVDELHADMTFLFGRKYADQWGGLPAANVKKAWETELAGLTYAELDRGGRALRALDWPPTIPEFIKLCRPRLDPVAAFHEAVAGLAERDRGGVGLWSHPAIFWATLAVGQFDVKNASYPAIKGRWESALAEQFARRSWDPIPAPPPLLANDGKASKEEAAKALADIGASGVFKPQADHKRWAKKLVARHAAGDKTVPFAALRMAREALQVEE